MGGFDPRLIVLFCLIFIGLGIYNIIKGRRKQRATLNQEGYLPWYRQTSILIGIEYILLSLTFLISVGISYRWFPAPSSPYINWLYMLVLLASAVLAGLVIFQTMRNSRQRPTVVSPEQAPLPQSPTARNMTQEEHAAHQRRRRERRKKAAEVRRKRAGKA
jgi:ABC-type Fe3+ transport system permease subunit